MVFIQYLRIISQIYGVPSATICAKYIVCEVLYVSVLLFLYVCGYHGFWYRCHWENM